MAPNRAAIHAERLLAEFPGSWISTWSPEDPTEAVGAPRDCTLSELFRFLEVNPDMAYTAYLRNSSGSQPYYAILCYCSDGSLVLGISGDEEEQATQVLLDQLEALFGVSGFCSVEEPPPDSQDAFRARVAEYQLRLNSVQ